MEKGKTRPHTIASFVNTNVGRLATDNLPELGALGNLKCTGVTGPGEKRVLMVSLFKKHKKLRKEKFYLMNTAVTANEKAKELNGK